MSEVKVKNCLKCGSHFVQKPTEPVYQLCSACRLWMPISSFVTWFGKQKEHRDL